MHFHNFKIALISLGIFFANSFNAQTKLIGDEPVQWSKIDLNDIQNKSQQSPKADLIILDEKTDLFFYAANNEKIVKEFIIKINSEEGLKKLRSFRLPESFDESYDANLFQQGRQAKIKIPYISEYNVSRFAGRKLENGIWKDISFKQNYEKLRWIKYTGEFVNDEITQFNLQNLAVGDVVELFYELKFNSNYGSNLFYLQSSIPKLNCEYSFTYKIESQYAGFEFILPLNIRDSCINVTSENYGDYYLVKKKIVLKNLKGINYPSNCFVSETAPHVFADFRFFRIMRGSYPAETTRLFDFVYIRPTNFEWMLVKDTNNNYTKVYDKQFASIRKFVATLPVITDDSSKVGFFKALCDTFNYFKFYTSNHLFYNESNLYNVYSADHLLKRRLVEQSVGKIYKDILNDNKTFYYNANLQDKRFGGHNLRYRAHYAYESNIIAIPNKNSFIYFMPRLNGVKYHLNELPFYFENTLAVLSAQNFQADINDKDGKSFKFIKTHKGTFNENTRTENATVRISLDSLKASFVTKESLSGQFSTLLRHLYLKDYIDSTVSKHYFKKCVEKPLADDVKIKLSSNITSYPFRYTFACSEKLKLSSQTEIDLSNWFSFFLPNQLTNEAPNQDYYFDFEFTDSYNFLLDFGTPVELVNAEAFKKKTNTPYFDFETELIKNSSQIYLLKVKLAIKETKIPQKEMALLMALVEDLKTINNFKINIAKL